MKARVRFESWGRTDASRGVVRPGGCPEWPFWARRAYMVGVFMQTTPPPTTFTLRGVLPILAIKPESWRP